MFGFAEEWESFQKRNQDFLRRFGNLGVALNMAFIREMKTSDPIDRVVLTMGKLCAEEFFELMLLAANGYGFGAIKLLRSLYEHAVTMTYLSEHPHEVHLFLNYHAVAQHKLLSAIRRTDAETSIPQKQINDVAREYERVKKDYEIADCRTCGTTRVNHTWNKLDFVSMAYKTKALADLIVEAYMIPLGHVHGTVQALLERVEASPSGDMVSLGPTPQPREADRALHVAHLIVLGILETQNKFFKVQGLDKPLEACFQDYESIWTPQRIADIFPVSD